MALSSNKRELQKKKQEKREEKQKRKEERKNTATSSFEDMIAYVDENGMIVSTPPDPMNRKAVELDEIVISTQKQEDTKDTTLEGYVDYFNPEKGYGFIKNPANGFKYFFHISEAPASIKEGNKVTFEAERGQKGMNAVNITPAP